MAEPNGAPQDVTATDPASLVRSFLAALERLDIDAAVAMVDDDIVYENKGLPKVRGRAQFSRTMSLLARDGNGFEVRMANLAVDGATVLTERVDVLVIGPVRAEFWVCGTFEVRDGRIVLWRDYFDFVNVTLAFVRGAVRALLERRSLM